MNELTASLVGGLLGGGVAGALIGGLIALLSQARSHRREDRYRFNESKREKYAALYVKADSWFRGVNDWYYALRYPRLGTTATITPIGGATELHTLAQEVRLLGDRLVERRAGDLVVHIGVVDRIRRQLESEGEEAIVPMEALRELGREDDPMALELGRSWQVLGQFFDAARFDLGTDRPGPLERLKRRFNSPSGLYRR